MTSLLIHTQNLFKCIQIYTTNQHLQKTCLQIVRSLYENKDLIYINL